ncbi:hypothetical protein PV703_11445 [Streptomyces sp. ME01-24h]|nr:hypothetical protein [Streptomyces sp. ME01-24h]
MTAVTVELVAPTSAAPLTLDERMALASLAMDERLQRASAAINVNTAHIETVEVLPAITGPVQTPEPPCPYTTPIAQLLHRAHAHLEAGWCRDALRDEQGAVCLLGAIRAAGATGRAYDMADEILYETIRRIDPRAHSTSGWNDVQMTSRGPLIVLERAARLADARGL